MFALALGTALGFGAFEVLPRSPYVVGLWVGGERLPDVSDLGPWIDRRRAEVRARPVVIHLGDQIETVTYEDLGYDLDISATLDRAATVGHVGSLVDRVREARAARRGEIETSLVYRVDETKARTFIESLAPRLAKAPVDATMNLRQRKKTPDVPGQALDVELSLASVLGAKLDDVNGTEVALSVMTVQAKVRTQDLIDVDVEKVLSSHETTFATFGVGVGRSQNILRAAEELDGTILAPGQVLSFNDEVGARTLERGFAWAPEIQGDELTTGVGGGTCQVSSTLFIAALFGALQVEERQSHSRPSAYAKLGLDATVVYGKVDLRIKNTMPFPVMIHAFLPKPGVLRVELLGGDPVAEVTYSYGIGHAEDFQRRITVKPHLKPGTRIRRQKGSRGYDVSSVVTIKWRNGQTEQRTYFSGYRPAPEVFWIAADYDESQLPPLPDHATGVEGRPYDDSYASTL